MIDKAIAKITKEMMESKNPAIRRIEEHLTGICTNEAVAEKDAREKAVRDALEAEENRLKQEAEAAAEGQIAQEKEKSAALAEEVSRLERKIENSAHENTMALCVSILKGVPPEKAFALLAGKPGRKEGYGRKPRKQWGRTEKDLMRLMRRKGETWGNIGRKFGISGDGRPGMHHISKPDRRGMGGEIPERHKAMGLCAAKRIFRGAGEGVREPGGMGRELFRPAAHEVLPGMEEAYDIRKVLNGNGGIRMDKL